MHVKLKSHAFNFGTVANGFYSFDNLDSNPTPGSTSYNYQQFVNNHFNALVPSNGGKWTYNENFRDQITMGAIDSFLSYAADHDLHARMHNLIWDTNQQPVWVQNLISSAAAGRRGGEKSNCVRKSSSGSTITCATEPNQYGELDVVNESLHQPRYWQIFGADGFAEFFNEAAGAIVDSGGNAKTMLNEFNVLQFSGDPLNPGPSDDYANWYREHIEEITSAGGQMSGVGVQYYADRRKSSDGLGSAAHSPAASCRRTKTCRSLACPLR